MSTLYSDTVSNILEMISDYRGETTTNTDAKRIRAISRSEKSIAKRTNWGLFQLNDQTTTSTGVAAYIIGNATYPMRNKGLIELFVDGTLESDRYSVVEAAAFKEKYNLNNAEQLCYVYYDPATDAWKVYISPTPETGKTITYSYFWIPPKRTLTSDSVFCVDMEALARLSLAEIYDGEDEGELAAIERNKVEQILSTEEGIDEAPSQSEEFADVGNGMGIGTY